MRKKKISCLGTHTRVGLSGSGRRLLSMVALWAICSLGYSPMVAQTTNGSKPSASSQRKHLSVGGVVRDASGQGVPGATVVVAGTKKGVVADLDGIFEIEVSSLTGNLEISSMGYITQTVAYKVGQSMKVVLKSSTKELEEVSVVAYGQRKTREVVSSISSIKSDQLKDATAPSLQSLLQGHVSGVAIQSSGRPGSGSSIVIRGHNTLGQAGGANINSGSPLFVVDGVPVQSDTSGDTGINMLAGLDPSTIESVEVLKDAASASLYGSRAGNGVILITTKKGRSGRPEFSVNFSQSISYLPETPLQIIGKGERDFNLLLAKKHRVGYYDWQTEKSVMPKSHNDTWGHQPLESSYDYLWNNGSTDVAITGIPVHMQDSLNAFYNNKTNWWKSIFQIGQVSRADVHASGGTENVRYMVGSGLYSEKGILVDSKFNRFSFISNLDFNLTPKLSAYTRVNMSYTDIAGAKTVLQVDPRGISPFLPGKGTVIEREAINKLRNIVNKNYNYNGRLQLGFNYNIAKGLSLNSSASVDHYRTSNTEFTPSFLTQDRLSQARQSLGGMTSLQSETLLNYKRELVGAHNIDAFVGFAFYKDIQESASGTARGGPSNHIRYPGDNWPKSRIDEAGNFTHLQDFTASLKEQAMISYFSRVAYNYDQKYLLEGALRVDGSSVFGRDVRWATFPSLAAGWSFSQERFMRDLWWLSFGKIRASWGRSGQKLNEPYLAHGIMGSTNIFLGTLGLAPTTLANTHLTWEKSDQYDFGLDVDLFNYRYKVKLDYYHKYSSALVAFASLPGDFFLLSDVWSNLSEIENQGVELEFIGQIIKGKQLDWTTRFNISSNWNRFMRSHTNIDDAGRVLGRPLYGLYVFQDEGIVQREEQIPQYYNLLGKKTPLYFGNENYPLRVGGRKIKDQNGDGVINNADLYYAGSTLPLFYGGWTNQLSWKGFTLTALVNFSIGRKMLNTVQNKAFRFDKNFGVIKNDYTKYTFWQKPGDQTDYPSLEFADTGYLGQFDGVLDSKIENVSYARLKQLTLSYALPGAWIKRTPLKDVRLYVTGENLFLLTNYSGLDPELVPESEGEDTGGEYPLDRRFTLGVNIKF